MESEENELKRNILKNKDNMTDADFNRLVDGHLANLAVLRKQRENEKKKMDEKMRLKMRNRNGRGHEDDIDEEMVAGDESDGDEYGGYVTQRPSVNDQV